MFGDLLAPHYLLLLLDGFLMSLGLALLSCVLATLIGAPLAIARLARRRWCAWSARAYLAAFRNTPLLVQLFFWYFGVPALPPLLGQYMNALKNSSLAMAIGLAELSYASRQVETETFKTFQAFGVATLLYIGAIAFIEALGQVLQHSRRYRQGGA